jgi:hypothetical protein
MNTNDQEWPRNLSDRELADESERTEYNYLLELASLNNVLEQDYGMLPNYVSEMQENVQKWRIRYDKIMAEIVRRIKAN